MSELSILEKVFNLSDVTKFPALQLQYIGKKTYAKVAVAAGGDMTITADDVDGETTTLLTVDLSSPASDLNTFGELKDYLNGHDDLRCFLIGVLPSQSTDDKLDTLSATSIKTVNGLTLFCDEAKTGNTDQGFAITNQKFTYCPNGGFESKFDGWVTDENCVNSLKYLAVNITNASSGNIEIYACDDRTGVNTATQIWDNAYSTGTDDPHGGSSPENPSDVFLSAPVGKRLLVWFDAAAAITGASIQAVGQTENIAGGPVTRANYTGLV